MKEHLGKDIDRGLRVEVSGCWIKLGICERVNRDDIEYGETAKRVDVVQIGVISQSRNSRPTNKYEASSFQRAS